MPVCVQAYTRAYLNDQCSLLSALLLQLGELAASLYGTCQALHGNGCLLLALVGHASKEAARVTLNAYRSSVLATQVLRGASRGARSRGSLQSHSSLQLTLVGLARQEAARKALDGDRGSELAAPAIRGASRRARPHGGLQRHSRLLQAHVAGAATMSAFMALNDGSSLVLQAQDLQGRDLRQTYANK